MVLKSRKESTNVNINYKFVDLLHKVLTEKILYMYLLVDETGKQSVVWVTSTNAIHLFALNQINNWTLG